MSVQDVDRPDVNGVPAKFKFLEDILKVELAGKLPCLSINASDNLCSAVEIRGTFDPKETWVSGIWLNSRHFFFNIQAVNRYYSPEDPKVVVELLQVWTRNAKFRKYTGPIPKVIEKIKVWIESNYETPK